MEGLPSTIDDNQLKPRDIRRVYLLTYSQADINTFPTRKSFAQAVVCAFSGVNNHVIQWCCSQEPHVRAGVHYHMCVKLRKCQRWLPVKKALNKSYGISVHFSDIHANYYTAWRYVTKQDESPEESDGHPNLTSSDGPKTMNAHLSTRMCRKKRDLSMATESTDEGEGSGPEEHASKSRRKGKDKKRKRLSAFEFSQIVVNNALKTRTAVLAFAHKQKNEGKNDMAEFIINRGSKVVNEAIANAWEMEDASRKQERMAKSRMEVIEEASYGTCKCVPPSQWHLFALQVLERNGIRCESFVKAVLELLKKGRGKYRNIMLIGPANCGKTFLLNPLNNIFKTFTNPASCSFAWVGAEEAEVLFLNDFRWSPQIIAWHDLLLMLEGQVVHLPTPKSHFAKDALFDKDTPVFATSKRQLVYVKNGSIDERETEMMSVRWKVFNFNWQIPPSQQREVVACATCFSRFVLGYEPKTQSTLAEQ